MLFTSTLAAHLKIGSDEPARTEKVQSINWATEAGVLQLDFSKKKKKKKKQAITSSFIRTTVEGETSLFRVQLHLPLQLCLVLYIPHAYILLSCPLRAAAAELRRASWPRGASAAHPATRNPRIIEGSKAESVLPSTIIRGIRGLFMAGWRTRGFVFFFYIASCPVLFCLLRPIRQEKVA
jgi:hypothetical protein